MNKLITILIGSMLLNASNAQARGEEVFSRVPVYILNAATAYDIDVTLMYAICMVESRCRSRAINHNDGTRSDKEQGIVKKSFGLFQIQLDTAKHLGFIDKETIIVTKKRGKKLVKVTQVIDHSQDLLKPEVNSLYAAKLLRKLYNKYGETKKVISAYNAGHYTKANKDYVMKVLTAYTQLKLDRRF